MNLIFVCTGNTCRSPMAEVIAKRTFSKAGLPIHVISRGISVHGPERASGNAVTAVANFGLDLSGHVAKPICAEDVQWADLILTMTQAHKMTLAGACQNNNTALFTVKEFVDGANGSIVDPFGRNLEEYINCAIELKYYIERMADIFLQKD